MRKIVILFVSVTLAIVLRAQTAPGDARIAVGVYVGPFVPQITTPSITFVTGPMQVGVSNTPVGDSARTSIFAEPAWYSQSAAETETAPEGAGENAPAATTPPGGFEFGVASHPSNLGAARLINPVALKKHSSRVYTNEDIAHATLNTGKVTFGGKTEHLD
jgi:hypothetical protein